MRNAVRSSGAQFSSTSWVIVRGSLTENLKKIVGQDPNNRKVFTELGALEFIFHDSENSINYLRKAINADPQNVEAYFWLAKSLFTYGYK